MILLESQMINSGISPPVKSFSRNFSFTALWFSSFPCEAQVVMSAFQRDSQAFGLKILCSDAKEQVLQASKNLST